MPLAQDLIEQARHLANREPKPPKQASLRDHRCRCELEEVTATERPGTDEVELKF